MITDKTHHRTMADHHRTMESYYDITMEPIIMSEVIIISHKQHRVIVQIGVFLQFDFKHIFISYNLSWK